MTRSKAGKAASSWLPQQTWLVTLCDSSETAPPAAFTGRLFSLTREAGWSAWDLRLCCYHLNMIKWAFMLLLIILVVIREEYRIFLTSEMLKAAKKCAWKQHIKVAKKKKKPGQTPGYQYLPSANTQILQMMLILKNTNHNPDLSSQRAAQKDNGSSTHVHLAKNLIV